MSVAPIFFDGINNNGRQDRPFLIFVEGTDDAHFLDPILQEIGADPYLIGTIIVGGTSKFASALTFFKKSRFFKNVRGIVIIRDADQNRTAAIKETNDSFLKEFNGVVSHAGFTETESLRLGLFVFPNEEEMGDLEKLCLSTVKGSILDNRVENYMTDIQKYGELPHFHKRKAQVFLAAIPGELCRGAGMGFKRGFFDDAHGALLPLKIFLKDFVSNSKEKPSLST